MPDTSAPRIDSGISDPAVKPPAPKPKRWQVGLRTLFLMTAVIAVWLTVLISREKNKALEAQIATMRPLARELVIEDPNQIAVVKREELWFDDNRWDLYLPPGQYRLCVATRDIDQTGFAPVVKSERIDAGRHGLELKQQRTGTGWQVDVTQDGAKRLSLEEPKEWVPAPGCSSGGGQYSLSTQLPADQPVVLFRRRFMRPVGTSKTLTAAPSVPCEGILLWIEPVSSSHRKP